MSQIKVLHEAAMDLAESADVAKLRGEPGQSQKLLRQALEQAIMAANQIAPQIGVEPTRSILHRSAASIAVELGEFKIAEQLITRGLVGSPPEDIAADLRDLFVQINLEHYFARRGLQIDTQNWVLSEAV